MFTRFRSDVTAIVVAACLPCVSLGAPNVVKHFDKATWAQMTTSLSKPSVVVFTTTDCSFCPAVIDALARELHPKGKSRAKLIVVVMDGAGQADTLPENPHYRRADDLYAFSGQDLALRYSVNPDWRGLTPYVALIPRKGAPRFVTGPPSTADLDALLASR
ncbi:MAG: hypothetical protein IPP88_14430 [Betaproteobacteria bacterium]|nr:hypothetical protein [Betaproteobacteria bacterium]